MKKIFTLIAVLFSITTFAADHRPDDSKISISNSDRSKMQVKIDGKMYNFDNAFMLDDIRSGKHSITIYKTEGKGFRTKTQVVYNTSLFIAANQLVSIDINRFGKVQMSQSPIRRSQPMQPVRGGKGNDNKYDNRH